MRSDDAADRTTQEHEAPRRRGYDRWSRKRLIEIGTLIVLIISIATSVSAYFSSRWATHSEVQDAVKPVVDTLRAVNTRVQRLESGQDSARAIRDLLIANSRYNCLVAERDRSTSLTEAAGLPCNALLGRIR